MSSVDGGSVSGGFTGGEKKTSWPEVVGLSVEEAKKIILKDMPDADFVILTPGMLKPLDWVSNRVFLVVDTVVQTPTVG
ncbi:hypothetical protein BAE44_0002508 [Dichanthelium oligosanthes]|uniref:Subtilisin-chymotrypsin inhibitor-2A n=1 Tax=Dichanthelium oligosanthes TaxID=888268 RepID=A0A1E5WGJ4_9POAL|nr:hypothetical protein BAE44_0002508 [Dichanthelium oligosanthes]